MIDEERMLRRMLRESTVIFGLVAGYLAVGSAVLFVALVFWL